MSSKRRLRRNQCGDKAKHKSADAARLQVRRSKVRDLQVYRCGFCSFYHVGHTPAKALQWR